MIYHSSQNSEIYFPPILGNGEISFAPTCEGSTDYRPWGNFSKIETFTGDIFRAGRRLTILHDRFTGQLLSLGKLGFSCGAELGEWSQELVPEEGIVKSHCVYPGKGETDAVCLIHPTENLYALNKMFHGNFGTVSYTYTLAGFDEDSEKAIASVQICPDETGAAVNFRMYGQDVYTGQAVIRLDRPAEVAVNGNSVTLSCAVKDGESVTMYWYVEDDFYGGDFAAVNRAVQEKICTGGFAEILRENVENWREYFSLGFVQTEHSRLDSVYRTALYHLRCYTTRWSIPVGLNNVMWAGKYFAFDEYYSFLGLLGANRHANARRIPEFRLHVCLEKAIRRVTKLVDEQAFFSWEANEYGDDYTVIGYWNQHVFHLALVALGAWEFYEHSGNLPFLRECYRMIRACAKYYTQHMLYRDGDRVYLGKCTDLERLGASVENPFFSSCGVIKTLEILGKASEVLDTDEAYRAECAETARKLRESLPVEEGRYVPYLNCPQKSVAVFAGKFPFHVLKDDDKAMLAAWKDFVENETLYGNMYVGGTQMSPWYACWKAEGFARAHRAEEAFASLLQVFDEVGVFDEVFEINEPGIRKKPWFCTAAGIYLSTVNEMLLQSDGERIELLPAYPESMKNASFRLSAKGGCVVEVCVENDVLKKLEVTMRPGLPAKEFSVFLRGKEWGRVLAKTAN